MFTCGPGFFGSGGAVVSPYKSELLFNGQPPGSTTYIDTGNLGATWTGGATASITTTSPIEGSGSLTLGGAGTSYIESSSFKLPATADFDLSFSIRPSQSPTSVYLASVQDVTPTAAGTQFALVTNASNLLALVVSDGTTRSTLFIGTTALASGTTYAILLTRRTSTLAVTINGVANGSGAFTGSFPQPVGSVMRIGKPLFGAATIYAGLVDIWRFN